MAVVIDAVHGDLFLASIMSFVSTAHEFPLLRTKTDGKKDR